MLLSLRKRCGVIALSVGLGKDDAMIRQNTLIIKTGGRSLLDITNKVQLVVADSGVKEGLCTVFIEHTSASLLISENADPDVLTDLEAFMTRLVPDGDPMFRHSAEGPDDMPAHIRSVLTQTSLSIPVAAGRCVLGTWQALYLWEHRAARHERKVTITTLG